MPGFVQFSAEVKVCGLVGEDSKSRLARFDDEDLAAEGLEKAAAEEEESSGRESSSAGSGKESGGGGSVDLGEMRGKASVKEVTSDESLRYTLNKVETWKGWGARARLRGWGARGAARCRRIRAASSWIDGALAPWIWLAAAFWPRILRRRREHRREATGQRRRTAWHRRGCGRARGAALRVSKEREGKEYRAARWREDRCGFAANAR